MSKYFERRVLVDDTDPRVVYSNPKDWFVDTSGLRDNVGNFGKALKSTLHGSSSNGSFQFSFSGTSADVFGFNDPNQSASGTDPSWECFVDNAKVPATKPFQYAENNWKFCSADALPDGNHTLVLNVKSTKQPFWLDYVVYTPSNITLDDRLVFISEQDSDLQYDSSWSRWGETWQITRTLGASLSFKFNGTRLGWYALAPAELPSPRAQASYAIDGGTETAFTIEGPSDHVTTYNQLIFQTPILAQGPHTLVVKFMGDNNTAPLALDYLIVETTPNQPAPQTSQTPVTAAVKSNRVNVAAVTCGVIFPLLFIGILFLLAHIFRRRRRIQPAPPAQGFTLASPPSSPVPTSRRQLWLSNIPLIGPSYWRKSAQSEEARPQVDEVDYPPARWKTFETSSPVQELTYHGLANNQAFSPWRVSPARPSFVLATPPLPVVPGPSHSTPSPSIYSADRDVDDGDRSYYGGYQTRKEIMAHEASARNSMVKKGH